MHNDPELSGKYLGQITQDFVRVSDTLKEASYQIRKRKFSDHPIFAIARDELPIGSLLISRFELNTDWNYYASYLDEFTQRELIDKEKVKNFIDTYKDPDEYCCLFIVDADFTNFVYIPYPVD